MEEMSIGEFARRSRLSPKALRVYDGLGLLSPARVDELSGYRYYEVPQRSLLCLKRNVDESGAWALGKEFIALIRDQRLPRIAGREGAMFSIYCGQVSADSDGPVEWCKPVPAAEAEGLAAQFPELTLRVEAAHSSSNPWSVGHRPGPSPACHLPYAAQP